MRHTARDQRPKGRGRQRQKGRLGDKEEIETRREIQRMGERGRDTELSRG